MAFGVLGVSIILSGLVILKFKELNGYLKYYGIWILIGTFIELSSHVLVNFHIPNLFLFHLNALFEFVLLVFFFNVLFTDIGDKGVKFILWPGVVAICFNSIFVQQPDTFNSYSMTLISLGTIVLGVYYFIRLSDIEMSLDKKLLRMFMVGSVLITHSSNMIPVLFGNYLLTVDTNTQMIVWILRACIILVVKIVIFYTLLSYVYLQNYNDISK